MDTNFIEKLRTRKSTFPGPEEANDKANALNTLSRDIYTDSTRFIYELLQNADDASCKSGSLAFQIDFIEDYLVVSHQGKPFDQDDVEAICSIGDGCKAADDEQTGFKGIGFKSVFAYSDCVIVKSGDFCFKFDKETATDVWASEWGNQLEWQQLRQNKNKSAKVNLPWQIIPINASVPDCVPSDIFAEFSVSTIIKCKKINELKKSIKELFSSAQLILFLRSKNVSITINFDVPIHIEKSIEEDITTISRDGKVISEWLMHTTTSFSVPQYVKDQMEEDKEHYPEKLREATMASISFAVSIKDGKIEKLEKGTKNIYAFLPTEVSRYDFPFIVNSNFITDAGRQNLHQDYIWNQWLFEEMPKHYMAWIAQIAEDGKYGLEFLKVINKKSGAYDKLGDRYNQSMANTLALIPILPNNGRLLKVAEAILDKTAISSYINPKYVIEYLGKNHKSYSVNGLLHKDYMLYRSQLAALGVTIFDEEKLKELISSEQFINEQDATENAKLINYLSSVYDLQEHKEETLMWLQNTPFILTESGKMLRPGQVCFPTINNGESKNIETICNSVYLSLSESNLRWLKDVGVSEVSDTSIIDTGKLFEDGYVTEENAIEIGRWLFSLYRKAKLSEQHYRQLRDIQLLTSKGTMKCASALYLSDKYQPDMSLEQYIQTKDIFVSSSYIADKDNLIQWKLFLTILGVNHTFCLNDIKWDKKQDELYPVLKDSWRLSKQLHSFGYYFQPQWYIIEYYPIISVKEENFELSKAIWTYLLTHPYDKEDHSRICGHMGDFWKYNGYDNTREPYLNSLGLKSFRYELLSKYQLYPSSIQTMLPAKDLYLNTPQNIELCGLYLPIINIDGSIHESWLDILPLKRRLSLQDLLSLLTKISEDTDNAAENKDRVIAIYKAILAQYDIQSQSTIETITEWSKDNMILSFEGRFVRPSELSYITVPGFNALMQVYVDNVNEDLLNLLRLFGVNIINHFVPEIENPTPEDNFKKRLLECAPLLALLSQKDRPYLDELAKIKERISKVSIMHVSSIHLTYEGNNDPKQLSTFYNTDERCFYFTGDWEKPRVIGNIVEPLCEILHIKKSYTTILSIILNEPIFQENKNYLEEQGFNVSCVTDDLIPLETTAFKGLTAREEMEIIENDSQEGNIPSSGVDGDSKLSYAKEAQQRIMELLEENHCAFDYNNHKYTLLYSVKKPDDSMCKVVMKSAQGGYLYFTPREWLELACEHPVLLLIDRNNQIRNVRLEELEESNDHFHMRFDTKIFAINSNLKVFAQFFRPLPPGSVYFVFGVPYSISAGNYLAEFGMDKQNTSAIDLTEDDINLLSQ